MEKAGNLLLIIQKSCDNVSYNAKYINHSDISIPEPTSNNMLCILIQNRNVERMKCYEKVINRQMSQIAEYIVLKSISRYKIYDVNVRSINLSMKSIVFKC